MLWCGIYNYESADRLKHIPTHLESCKPPPNALRLIMASATKSAQHSTMGWRLLEARPDPCMGGYYLQGQHIKTKSIISDENVQSKLREKLREMKDCDRTLATFESSWTTHCCKNLPVLRIAFRRVRLIAGWKCLGFIWWLLVRDGSRIITSGKITWGPGEERYFVQY